MNNLRRELGFILKAVFFCSERFCKETEEIATY